jgi:hypothetical protein
LNIKKLAALPLAMGLWLSPSVQANSVVTQVDNEMAQWLDLERQRSALALDWQQSKPLLEQRLGLMKAEKQQLEALLANQQAASSEAEAERLKLTREQSGFEAAQQQLEQWLEIELVRARALLPQLPPPLARQWQGLLEQAAQSKQANIRLEKLLDAYGKLKEFNRRIATFEDEVIGPDGAPLLVRQLYLGAGQGWYLTLDGARVMQGRAHEGEWRWSEAADVTAKQLERIFAMAAFEREAKLERLPLQPLPELPASAAASASAAVAVSAAAPSGGLGDE